MLGFKRPTINQVAKHILLIALFITYEITIILIFGTGLNWIFFIPYYFPGIVLFYINALLVMRLWKGNTKGIATALILVELLCHFALYLWIDISNIHSLKLEITRIDYIKAGYRTVYIFTISMTYWMVLRNKKQAQEIFELKFQALVLQNKQVILENAYLRAKANPHLAFNVLDVIYGNLEHEMPAEANVIKRLTDTMDYAIAEIGSDGKVTLDEEITQVETLIAIYQYLNRDLYQVQLAIIVSEEDKQARIPPLILTTLVENIFMHGNLIDEVNPATIMLTYKSNRLSFRQSNLIAKHDRKSHGLGLDFVQKCLSFYYPERFDLNIRIDKDIYSLTLTIEL